MSVPKFGFLRRIGSYVRAAGVVADVVVGPLFTRQQVAVQSQKLVGLATAEHLTPLAVSLSEGATSLPAWQAGMRQNIKNLYIDQYMISKGGRAQMTQQDWGRLGQMIKDQYRYLDKYALDLSKMDVAEKEAYIRNRSQLYANASNEAFERGKSAAAQSLGMDEVDWNLTPVENCETCIRRSQLGPQPMGPRGGFMDGNEEVWPADGTSICMTNDKCFLSYSNSETGQVWEEAGPGRGWWGPPVGTHGTGSGATAIQSTNVLGPVQSTDVTNMADLQTFAQTADYSHVRGSVPTEIDGKPIYAHDVRWGDRDLDRITNEGFLPSGEGRFWASQDHLREKGTGFVLFTTDIKPKRGTDVVERGLSYPESIFENVHIPPSGIVKVVHYRSGVREDQIAKYALNNQGLINKDIRALPDYMQGWFQFETKAGETEGIWEAGPGRGWWGPPIGTHGAGKQDGGSRVSAQQAIVNSPPHTGSGVWGDPTKTEVRNAEGDAGYDGAVKRAKFTEAQTKVIEDYQNGGYGLTNAFLRGDETAILSGPAQTGNIRELDSVVMSGTLPMNYMTYRAWGQGVKPQSGFTDNGFVSVSTSRYVAQDFADKFGGSVTRVVIPAGTRVGLIEKIGHKGEGEILLGRGAIFQRRKLADGSFGLVYQGSSQ